MESFGEESEPEPVAHNYYYPTVTEIPIVRHRINHDDFIDGLSLNIGRVVIEHRANPHCPNDTVYRYE